MADQGFQDVMWSDDQDIDTLTLNQMTSNDRWLYNNMSQGYYNVSGIQQTRLKIACGIVVCPPQTGQLLQGGVAFGSFFNPIAVPVVNITISPWAWCYYSITGPNFIGNNADATGFSFSIVSNPQAGKSNNYFPQNTYVNWTAIGF